MGRAEESYFQEARKMVQDCIDEMESDVRVKENERVQALIGDMEETR